MDGLTESVIAPFGINCLAERWSFGGVLRWTVPWGDDMLSATQMYGTVPPWMSHERAQMYGMVMEERSVCLSTSPPPSILSSQPLHVPQLTYNLAALFFSFPFRLLNSVPLTRFSVSVWKKQCKWRCGRTGKTTIPAVWAVDFLGPDSHTHRA